MFFECSGFNQNLRAWTLPALNHAFLQSLNQPDTSESEAHRISFITALTTMFKYSKMESSNMPKIVQQYNLIVRGKGMKYPKVVDKLALIKQIYERLEREADAYRKSSDNPR
jgi:hypothetical protein